MIRFASCLLYTSGGQAPEAEDGEQYISELDKESGTTLQLHKQEASTQAGGPI
jgi:hypothetical protein